MSSVILTYFTILGMVPSCSTQGPVATALHVRAVHLERSKAILISMLLYNL